MENKIKETYDLSFAFTINAFGIYVALLVLCITIFLIIRYRKQKEKHKQTELQKKTIIDNSANPVEIAQLFCQLKEIGQENIVKNARYLIVEKYILDMLLTDTILRVVCLENITSTGNGRHVKDDVAELSYKSTSYLIILTSNERIMYGLHLGVDADGVYMEVHKHIYVPFQEYKSLYKFCRFTDLNNMLSVLINVSDMFLVANDSTLINNIKKKSTKIKSTSKALNYSLSGSRDYSKYFWQPEIVNVDLIIEQIEVSNESN
jgi:hypothetical protein